MATLFYTFIILLLEAACQSQEVLSMLPSQPSQLLISFGTNCVGFEDALRSLAPAYCGKFLVASANEEVFWKLRSSDVVLNVDKFERPEALFCFGLYDTISELCRVNKTIIGELKLQHPTVGHTEVCSRAKDALTSISLKPEPMKNADFVHIDSTSRRKIWATSVRTKFSDPVFCEHWCVYGREVYDVCSKFVWAAELLAGTAASSHSPLSAFPVQPIQRIASSTAMPNLPPADFNHKSSSYPLKPSKPNQSADKVNIVSDRLETQVPTKPKIQQDSIKEEKITVAQGMTSVDEKQDGKLLNDQSQLSDVKMVSADVDKKPGTSKPEVPPMNEEDPNDEDPGLPADQQSLQVADEDLMNGPDLEQLFHSDNRPVPQMDNKELNTLVLMDKNDNSNLLVYFILMTGGALLFYFAFHNKNKLLALALEGRRTHRRGERHHSASYSKLHSNLEEAIVCGPTSPSATHVLY